MGRNYLKRARRRLPAGIKTRIGNHTFRATGITAYLKNGGMLETAQQMAAHESPRTTGLYDRRSDDLSLDRTRSPWRCATSAPAGRNHSNTTYRSSHTSSMRQPLYWLLTMMGSAAHLVRLAEDQL
jgi:hypothetical protein